MGDSSHHVLVSHSDHSLKFLSENQTLGSNKTMKLNRKQTFRQAVLLAALTSSIILGRPAAAAEISLTGNTASENFDGIGSTATATLPSGWVMSAAGVSNPSYAATTNLTATTQAYSSGSPTAGARYNWGNGTTTTDRAIGFMTSGSYASPSSIMVGYVNNNATAITAVTLAFNYERYRINTAAAAITFFYSTDGSTWTSVTAGDSGAFTTGASAYGFPKDTINKTGVNITGLSIAAGAKIYFRWYFNTTGANSQGLGLDDFSLSATVVAAGNPPVISSILPASVITNAGSTVAYTVAYTGDTAASRWYSVAGSATNLIPSAASTTLTLTNVLAATPTNFFVVLSNAVGSVTSSVVTLAVIDPAINVQPVGPTAFVNTRASLSVGAAGTSLAYQWYQGTPDAPTPVINDGVRIAGATSSTLVFTNLQAGDAANYFVIVTNSFGSATSSVVAVTAVTTGVLAEWDFNGNFNTTTPAPSTGSGTASLLNGVPGSSAAGSSPNDTLNASHEGVANNAWSTTSYPTSGSNKTAGVQFNVSTLGLRNIKISYDIRASATASKFLRLQYTTNGTDFIDYPVSTAFANPTYFESEAYDLTGLPGVANNASFGFRVVSEFESTASYNATNDATYVGASSAYGNGGTIRFDIVTVSADSITGSGTPPSISSFGNITMTDEAAPTNMSFTVNDAQTAAGDLTVTAVSENQNALPNGSLSISSTGGTGRVLTVTPALGYNGIAPVMVTVTDGDGDSTTTSFYVTVTPANQPPTINVVAATNILINSNIVINFTVGDDFTLPNNLVLSTGSGNSTLVPPANIVLGGSGTNRTITIVPSANQVGVAPITITATDDDTVLAKSRTATIILQVRPNTTVLLNDYFDYADGVLTTTSGGFWQNHSGTAGQLQVATGQAAVNANNSEDVNAPLIGQPYTTSSSSVLYSSFTANFSALPTDGGAYIAHFKDTNTGAATGFGARVWASTLNAATGDFRLGIGNGGAATNTSGQFPLDLVLNSNYTVVTRFVPSTGVATIWINPATEADTSITANDVTNNPPNPINVVSYALRENTGGGTLTVDNLKVGLKFLSVITNIVDVAPAANADAASVTENTTNNVLNPLANDVLNTPLGTLVLVSVSPTNGTATISGTTVLFTPTNNFVGTATIGYTIVDGFGGTSTSLITVAVTNIAPVANPDAGSVAKNSLTNLFTPLTNDVVNTVGGSLSIVSASPANGTVIITNGGQQLLFTPTTGFVGSTTIGYTISDGIGGTASSTITVSVVDTAPPVVHSQFIGGNFILSWDDPSLYLQSSTNVEGPYSNVPGATSPFTNDTVTVPTLFFRLTSHGPPAS